MTPALIIIDSQNDFKPGATIYSAEMFDDALIGRIAELIADCRAKNMPIIYTQHSINPDKTNAELNEPEDVRACIIGTPGWEIVDEHKPEPSDIIIRKDKYDAFVDTEIDTVLRTLGVDSVILCGVLTNNCVRATAEGAHYKHYHITIVSDCCGGTSMQPDFTHEQLHDITLRDLRDRIYGLKLVTLGELR